MAITGDRIAAVEADFPGDAAHVVNATGKLVLPRLLDIHTYDARDEEGPRVGLPGWVTGRNEIALQMHSRHPGASGRDGRSSGVFIMVARVP